MQYQEAQAIVNSWGAEGKVYKTEPDYQSLLRELTARFPYRLDTNFAKIDRIALGGLEAFKQNVMQTIFIDRSVHM